MDIKEYIYDNRSLLISETKALFDTLNKGNFAKAVVNNIREQSQEWNEPVPESDKEIKALATRYYREYIEQ